MGPPLLRIDTVSAFHDLFRLLEFISGCLLVIGLLSSLCCAALIIQMIVAALSRTSPYSISTHRLWLALNRKIGNLKSLDHFIRSREHIGRDRQADLLRRFQIDD
jgi:hypothetical protein